MIKNVYSNVDFLKKALDGTWVRNEAISNNIANVNTPGYKKNIVEFENILKDEIKSNGMGLKATNEKHIKSNGSSEEFNPIVKEQKNTSTRLDDNNVNIDVEMANLAKNAIMYDALIRQVSNEFIKIRNVIEEGSK
ncbi:flagellar basal body rod protein FlgB [Sporosalibacterium faouarense]|uniref:flagellar basal body rod protein FlgB n=1 Tax=Sporosalibacterium faouarense TaxID=516123 RepID=UPI00141CD252|nr:flagellar basal body rod protein FlgB [Sporosalibacterium faouarense]MTI47983.1 flagellar basal body rod protein FlgB [Bacillota bacterium]